MNLTYFKLLRNNFDLGKKNGKSINDVILPKWASSPEEFVCL